MSNKLYNDGVEVVIGAISFLVIITILTFTFLR